MISDIYNFTTELNLHFFTYLIKEPISKTTNFVEAWRLDNSITAQRKKQEVKTLLNKDEVNNEKIENLKPESEKVKKKTFLFTPFNYVKLFFYTLFQFILEHGLIFYGLIIFIILGIIRHLWHKML